jgi:hypothetical protein
MPERKPLPKTQREIFNAQVDPYAPGQGNPNNADALNSHVRANQQSFKNDDVKPFSIGIQDIDEAILYYFTNIIKPTVYQNLTQIPVPVIYGSPERWKAVQSDGYYRDQNDKIMSPLIMYRRTSIEKNYGVSNKLDANHPYNYGIYGQKWSNKNAYDNFAILNNKRPQTTTYAVAIPDYVTITYECMIMTYYVEQMNKIVEAIQYASDSYWGNPERFKFIARISSFTTSNTINQGEERLIQTTFDITLKGHIIPDTINAQLSSIKTFQGPTQVVFSTETTITPEDSNPGRDRVLPQNPDISSFVDPPLQNSLGNDNV